MNSREPIDYIQRTRDQYDVLGYPPYRWVQHDDEPPWEPLVKPLSECKVGLVASGGIYAEGQIAFHFKDDISLRLITDKVPKSALRISHFAYDHSDARRDPNVVFPRDALNDLADQGFIGSFSERAYTFMGGIYSSSKVRKLIAPELTRRLIADEVDLVILVPV
ncbi:MAG: glycine/betaine/sarcosine/D-proline family reductase selenoprotein B [Pseudomonadales bacterium]|nr:glycine/betaine/sarcosine/D-proline family reductase selenoprotein B [Pseudomonadales bacterium]